MIKYLKFTVIASAICTISACNVLNKSNSDLQERWDSANSPAKFGADYVTDFARLPLNAELSFTPWADTYWPSYKGGIAARWNEEQDKDYSWTYKLRTKEELKKLTSDELRDLSPAEKLDIAMGNYNYPTVNMERRRVNPNRATWEGICHGWAPAALNFKGEPKQTEFVNPDGIKIPFGSSDVKGLLSYYQGQLTRSPNQFLGLRCGKDLKINPEFKDTPECKGVNAATFHIILANHLGIKKTGFVADITRDLQVWNHPVFAFTSVIESEKSGASATAAPGTVKEITVTTKMMYRVESVAMRETSNDDDGFTSTKIYKYRLELNSTNQIIGGTWLQEDRPDFLWTQQKPSFAGKYAVIGSIYNQSTK